VIRDRIFQRLGIQTEPELVDKASRCERVKRDGWMTVSAFIAIAVAAVPFAVVEILTGGVSWALRGPGVLPLFTLLSFLVLGIFVDLKLWRWGVQRFELVAPWQFREERARDDEVSEA
jgi:hypothetical protein